MSQVRDHKTLQEIVYNKSNQDPADRSHEMQIVRVGKFFDPRYGKFEITKKMLSQMVKNFESNVMGIKPALDYSHKSDEVAAGWFKELYIKNSGEELWAKIEMTPTGQKVLSDKEFAYISADFDENYIDNESGEKHGCVLRGAGLTNRPVIKRMDSVVQLSEEQKMAKELEQKISDLEKELSEWKEMAKKLGCDTKEKMLSMIENMKGNEKKMSEVKDTEKKLSEANEKLLAAETKIQEFEKKMAEQTKENEFNKLLSEGKVVVAQKESFMKGDMIEFMKNAVAIKTLAQGASGENADKGEKDPEDEVMEKAKTLSEKEKLSTGDAIRRVLAEDKDLANRYYLKQNT